MCGCSNTLKSPLFFYNGQTLVCFTKSTDKSQPWRRKNTHTWKIANFTSIFSNKKQVYLFCRIVIIFLSVLLHSTRILMSLLLLILLLFMFRLLLFPFLSVPIVIVSPVIVFSSGCFYSKCSSVLGSAVLASSVHKNNCVFFLQLLFILTWPNYLLFV